MSAPSPTLNLLLECPLAPPLDTALALSRLLGVAQPRALPARSAAAWSAALMGWPGRPPWAAACWAAAQATADGAAGTGDAGIGTGGTPDPGNDDRATCLILQPVQLAAGMHTLSMRALPEALDAQALRGLAALLQESFRLEGAQLLPWRDCLLVKFDGALEVETTALAECAGRDLRDCLPRGGDAARLRRLMTEAQMILHACAAGLHGSTPGLPGATQAALHALQSVQGVWLSGEGTLRPGPGSAGAVGTGALAGPASAVRPGGTALGALQVEASDPFIQVLAQASGCHTGQTAPARGGAGQQGTGQAGAGQPGAGQPGSRNQLWQGSTDHADLPALLAQARKDLRRGRLKRIEISLWPGPAGDSAMATGGAWVIRRRDLWRFWRRPLAPWTTTADPLALPAELLAGALRTAPEQNR